jgi:phosphoglucomutase/phosphomannomutase
MSGATIDREEFIKQVQAAANVGKLSSTAAANLRIWLTEPHYAPYLPAIAEHVTAARWKALDDAFWTIIPFGTGGRRGKMYPIGTATINERTIGESAQGLADYVRQQREQNELSCAIAYDTRHRSREFAELCAEIMVGNGFKVFFLDGYRSTPELSFAVRLQHCACGIMITASHNPPSDNAVKVYWSTGGQLLPPHDKGVIDCVMRVTEIARSPWAEAVAAGKVMMCEQEVDAAYQAAVLGQSMEGPRSLKVVYSPMHGVGAASIIPVLTSAGFTDVEVFEKHAKADGDFPNVPGHVANPENPATYESIVERAKEIGADLVLSTDPDADRLGCAAPDDRSQWRTFTGNQIGALLTDYILESRRRNRRLGADAYVVKTLVTTEMIRRIAESYGVKCHGQLQVGFKYIGQAIDEFGPANFVFGAEESHGYLAGHYTRDKDATVAAMLMAELAAAVKANKQTLHAKLDALFWQHGCHVERQVSRTLPGAEGMAAMKALMTRLRSEPPKTLGGINVVGVRDYLKLEPHGDMVMIDLKPEGNYVAVRPSGTEPKIKFYLFAYEPAEMLANLETTKAELEARLDAVARDLAEM